MDKQTANPTSPSDSHAKVEASGPFDVLEVEQLRRQVIDALTRIATGTAGGSASVIGGQAGRVERIDMADLVAGVLAAVAANVGSTGRLLAGRPGSWEADLVAQLLAGTVGHDDEYLIEHRTAEIVVPLNVLDLVWDHPGFPDVEQALGDVYAWHAAIPDDRHDPAMEWADEDVVLDAYAAAYADYAARFTAAVTAAAARIPGLAVPVRVVAVHDPRLLHGSTPDAGNAPGAPGPEDVHNPDLADPTGTDQFVLTLWAEAFAAVSAPVVGPLAPKTADPSPATGRDDAAGGVR